MNAHPGGEAHSLRMLELSGLEPPAGILDMGAGAGETVLLFSAGGFDTVGIDIAPRGDAVLKADMLSAPFEDCSFDGIISQCAFYVSGDVPRALHEAYRMLRRGGVLMLSDVWTRNAAEAVKAAGFRILHREDMTPLWREYYIDALWRGDEVCCNIRGKCSYELLICRKD